MKTNKLIMGGLALSFLFAGCKKLDSSSSSTPVSTADLASAVSSNLATNGYGVVSQLQDGASLTSAGIGSGGTLAVSAPSTSGLGTSGLASAVPTTIGRPADTLPCGFTKKINFAVSDSSNGFAHSHSVKYYFQVNCTNGVRTGVSFSDSSSGHFNGPRLITNSSSNGVLTISGIQKADTVLTYNGSITHKGSYQSKVNDSISFSSTIVMNLQNTLISKKTHEVVGGTSAITISGVNKKKVPFSYTGTIEFIGGRKAKIKINNDIYVFNLVSGDLDR